MPLRNRTQTTSTVEQRNPYEGRSPEYEKRGKIIREARREDRNRTQTSFQCQTMRSAMREGRTGNEEPKFRRSFWFNSTQARF